MNDLSTLEPLLKSGSIGVFAVFALLLVKTVLSYVKPPKNGHISKDLAAAFQPIQDRQTALLERMNEREIIMSGKIESDHKVLKNMQLDVHDTHAVGVAMHKRFDNLNLVLEKCKKNAGT